MFLPPPSLAVISIILGFCTQRASQLPSLFSQDVWDVFPLISGKKRIYQVILQFFDFPLFVYDILSLSFTPPPPKEKKGENSCQEWRNYVKLWPFEGHLGRVHAIVIWSFSTKIVLCWWQGHHSFLAPRNNTFPYDEKPYGGPICFWEITLFCSICKSYQSSSVCSVILTLVLVRGSWKDICSRYWQACTWLSDDKGHWFQG